MATTKWSAAALVLVLGACSITEDNQQAAAPNLTSTESAGVTRETVEPTPAPVIAPTQTVLQSQPGPEGNTVALNKVAVTGDILTVSTTFGGGSCCAHIPVAEVSVIDDATSQRISVLKDNAGQFLAAPLENGGKTITPADYDKPSVVWFKFPAPPPTSKTVSITIPGVAPFDAVPVTR